MLNHALSSNGTDTLHLESVTLTNTELTEASLVTLIDAMSDPTDLSNPFATSTISFAGTPADTNITAPTIAAAAAKNITLVY